MDTALFVLDKNLKMIGALDNRLPLGLPFSDDIHWERLDGWKTFDFSIPANHANSDWVQADRFILYPNLDRRHELFRIMEVNEVNKEGKYIKQVSCEGVAIPELNVAIVRPAFLPSYTLDQAVSYVLTGTDWQVGDIEYAGTQDITFSDYITALEALNQVIATFNVELQFTVDFTGTQITAKKANVRIQRGTVTEKPFIYKRDIIEVTRTENTRNVVTALIGVGKGDQFGNTLTFSSLSPTVPAGFEKQSDWVGSLDAFSTYNINGLHRFGVYKDTKAVDATTLWNNTLAQLQKLMASQFTYSTSVISLERLIGYEAHKVRIGDTVRVIDETFNPALRLEARVMELKRSKTDSTQDEVTLGQFIPIFSSQDMRRVQATVDSNSATWGDTKTTVDGWRHSTDRTKMNGGQVKITNSGTEQVETGRIDGLNNGFDTLTVGTLNSSSVASHNITDYTIYVDPVAGDDNNDGLTTSTQKLTLQGAINILPDVNDGNITILIKSGTTSWTESTTVTLQGVMGAGTVTIDFQARTAILNGRMMIQRCTNQIEVKNGSIKNPESFATTFSSACLWVIGAYVRLTNMYFDAKSGAKLAYCVNAGNAAFVRLESCEAYNGQTAQILASYGGSVDIEGTGCKGSGGQYGIYVVSNALVGGDPAALGPTGSVAAIQKTFGGQCDATFTSNAGTPPSAGATSTTTTQWTATSTKSFRPSGWRTDNSNVYQGDFGYGNHTGLAWFNASDIRTKLAGKTINSIRLNLTRLSGGVNAAQSVNIYSHNYTSQPAGAPTVTQEKLNAGSLAVGSSGWITLPVAVGNKLRDNTAQGIATYTSSGSPYMIFDGTKVILEITYTG